ncbi:MAG: hypothetical protein ACM3WR_13720 [Solirubrobacterales bacterium]|jgi:hypothetical protein
MRALTLMHRGHRVDPRWRATGDDAGLGRRLLEILGEPAARELLGVLERSDEDRAALVRRLRESERGRTLADLLADIGADPDDLVRLRLIGALETVLG